MRVLLLGVTGRVGSHLFPSLLAHGHEVVPYVRNPSKLSSNVTSRAAAIVTGSAAESDKIKTAILSNQCDAVVSAAGRAGILTKTTEFPTIFAAVTKAAHQVSRARGEKGPLRCWLLSGWPMLDSPVKGRPLADFIPTHKDHVANYELIKSIPTSELAWSLFCASVMAPRSGVISYPAVPGNDLIASADVPPAWEKTLLSVPLVGTYLNILSQTLPYYASLEDCADFIAEDLTKGLASENAGKRVGVKERCRTDSLQSVLSSSLIGIFGSAGGSGTQLRWSQYKDTRK